MSQANVAVVRACFEAFDRGELRAAADLLDVDVEWDPGVLIDQTVIHGRKAVLQFWEQAFSTFPFAHEAHRFIDAEDQICVLAYIRGKGIGSGIELAQPCGYAVAVDDGAIIRSRFFAAHAEALEAVGLEG
jgi:ketosteroid isomerase-like protein